MLNKLKNRYNKENNKWFCRTCSCELYTGKKKYLSLCFCLPKTEQSSLYENYLSDFYTTIPTKYGLDYTCKKCNHSIQNSREKHYFSCYGLGTKNSTELNLNPNFFSKYCEMGCGQESKFFHKNGKAYCSKNGANCPIKVDKDRKKKIGNLIYQNRPHPRLGVSPASKGKTKETCESVAKQALSQKKTRAINGHNWTGKKHSNETKLKFSAGMNKRYASGWEPVCGRAKKYKHISPIAGEIYVDGTWELSFAQLLDRVNIPWDRNKKRFNYINLKSKKSTYQPDFFIPNWNKYIEVKGYKTDLDVCKWTQFNEPLLVVTKEHIKIIKSWLKNNEFVDEIKLFELIGQSTKEKYL